MKIKYNSKICSFLTMHARTQLHYSSSYTLVGVVQKILFFQFDHLSFFQ